MNNHIDDLIRDAVRRQEELAVAPDRIRAALPARAARQARAHRTRTLIAVAAAASVAVAVAVPTFVLNESADVGAASSPTTPPPAVTSTGPTTAATPSGAATAPLRFKPTWVPPGLTEWQRSVPLTSEPDAKASLSRIWKTTPADEIANLGLYAYTSPQDQVSHAPPVAVNPDGTAIEDRNPGREVEINGKPGYFDGRATITWQVDPRTKLMLVAPELGLSEADLFRVANSVQPDDTRLHLPLHTGPLPGGVVAQFATVDGESANSWEAGIFAARGTDAYVSVRFGTVDRRPAVEGEAVTVRGVPARLARPGADTSSQFGYRTDWVLTADLGDGRRLTVHAGSGLDSSTPALTGEDVLRIAEQVELDPNADLGWLGR